MNFCNGDAFTVSPSSSRTDGGMSATRLLVCMSPNAARIIVGVDNCHSPSNPVEFDGIVKKAGQLQSSGPSV
jgi:hypothetical protein